MTDARVDPGADDDVAWKTACASGHNEVIKLLLTDDRVDPAAGSNHGIKFAAENGHELVVQTLLEDPRVDPADDGTDANFCTILMLQIMLQLNGHQQPDTPRLSLDC